MYNILSKRSLNYKLVAPYVQRRIFWKRTYAYILSSGYEYGFFGFQPLSIVIKTCYSKQKQGIGLDHFFVFNIVHAITI